MPYRVEEKRILKVASDIAFFHVQELLDQGIKLPLERRDAHISGECSRSGKRGKKTKHPGMCRNVSLVGLVGLEPTASSSRTKRATNCAIARRSFAVAGE